MRHDSLRTLATLAGTASLLATGQLAAAEPKHAPAKVEHIQGTELSRVILTEQAEQRLGIATIEIREMAVVRKRLLSGVVGEPAAIVTTVATGQGGASAPPSPEQTVQLVKAQPVGELDRTARWRPARVLPLNGADKDKSWLAEPAGGLAVLEHTDPNDPLIFQIRGAAPSLPAPGPVLVEVTLSDGGAVRKVAPYDAVLYDIRGDTWVYTMAEQRTFVRHSVVVEYIDNGLAVLSQGPPPGTKIVSVGVAELYGTEFKIGK